MHKKQTKRLRTALLPTVVLGASLASPGVSFADYLVQKGDVLAINVAGLPDLQQNSSVDVDGNVIFPLSKPVHAAGLPLSKIEDDVKSQISKSLYQHVVDGRDQTTAIPAETISLRIAAYRPIYVDGDVSKPGAQTFTPGITVRQAVSLAGGYEIMRFRMNNPFLEGADLKSDYDALWLEYVHEQSEVWRLKRLLQPDAQISLDKMTEAPLPSSVLAEARDVTRKNANEQVANNVAELAYLLQGKKTLDDQIEILQARQVKDDENTKVDDDEYKNLKNFSLHGNLPMTRLTEARRLLLFSSTQALQTQVQTADFIRLRDDADRKVHRFTQDMRFAALKDLSEAETKVETIRSKLQAVSEKIVYTGIIRSQMARGGADGASIHIVRGSDTDATTVSADSNTLLSPGDTIEVALHTEAPVPAPGQ